MAPIIPDDIPVRIAAGTTVKFHRSFGDYPASAGWSYIFYAVGPTTRLAVPATTNPDGQSFDIVIPTNVASLTTPSFATLPAGRYQIAERLTQTPSGEVYDPSLDTQQIVVELSVATAAAGAFQSHPEQALVLVEAALLSRYAADIAQYTIGQRQVMKEEIIKLQKTRGMLLSAIWRLKNPGKLGAPVFVDFSNEPEEPTFPPTWVDVTGLDR